MVLDCYPVPQCRLSGTDLVCESEVCVRERWTNNFCTKNGLLGLNTTLQVSNYVSLGIISVCTLHGQYIYIYTRRMQGIVGRA